MINPIGKHIIIECRGEIASCNQQALTELMTRSAIESGATILSNHFHGFDGGQGITGVLVLAESHITVHTWPEFNYVAFDVFMCGDCDPQKAANIIASHEGVTDFTSTLINRGLNNRDFSVDAVKRQCIELCESVPLLTKRLIDQGIAKDEVDAANGIEELLRFLALCVQFDGVLTPSNVINEYWHTLILFTQAYHDICDTFYGRFIHHQPNSEPSEEADQYERTLQLYLSLYGELNPQFWCGRGDSARHHPLNSRLH